MTTIIVQTPDNAHWYTSTDGAPRYTVKAKDGSDRPTTLRDARTMNLVPSVTTILKVHAKPGLEVWKNEQMLLAALTLPRAQGESEKSFISRVVADSKETAKAAAGRGTLIHESIEKWYCGDKDVRHPVIADAFEKHVTDHFGQQDWIAEKSFASQLGFGGKVDLHCPNVVIDAKTKEFGPSDEVAGYDEHLMQLAAYRHGLGLPSARCANVFASVSHPGLIKIVEWSDKDLQKGWEMFTCLLNFWQLKHDFGGKT
jgi:uncharacterized protein Usg